MRPVFDISAVDGDTVINPDIALKWGRLVKKSISEEAFPGCVIYIAVDGQTVFHRPFGRYTYAQDSTPVSLETIYDLASVTKVSANIPMVMKLWELGKLRFDMRVIDFFPSFRGGEKDKVTLLDLITHSSGLPSYHTFYKECSSFEDIFNAIVTTPLKHPIGTKTEYSDLGMILMGEIVQKLYGAKLDVAANREIHSPLGMNNTFYRPIPELKHSIAPTEIDPWRGRLLQGEVHDENAYVMGGVSGHAGLFSVASDLGKYCQCILNGGSLNGVRIFKKETIGYFSKRPESLFPGGYALGWRFPPYRRDGKLIFSPGSIGHTGYTGTSIWMDRKRNTQIVILSNRVHPSRSHTKITGFRTEFQARVLADLFPS